VPDCLEEGVYTLHCQYVGRKRKIKRNKSVFFCDACGRWSLPPPLALALVKVFNCCAMTINCKKEDCGGKKKPF